MNRLMKLFLVMLLGGVFFLYAQDEEMNDMSTEINDAMVEVQTEINSAMDEIGGIDQLNIDITDSSSDSPKLGVFLSNLDFEDLYEMHYDYNYGVYVSGVTSNSPAQKAGIMKDDIIMEFDGQKAKFERHLVNMIKSKQIGDVVDVKIFRLGSIIETKVTLTTLDKPQKDMIITKTGEKKKKLSVGHGGGSWYPIWFTPDVTAFNTFLANMDFGDETFSEDGFLIHGGGGMGNVGKGWFIGGMGAGYDNKETTKHPWTHWVEDEEVTNIVSRTAKYNIGFGGVTLDKRFAFSNKFLGSIGFMLGGGHNEFIITQNDDNGEITNFDFEVDPSGQFDGSYDYKSKLSIKSDYMVFQPKAVFMWRILNWLSFRTEVGYMLSYSSKGWQAKWNGESVKLNNPPDASIDGLTVSIGPWFGF
ncbi:MAG: PDZ domain-containing protein [Candidatus Cloacimonadales bacterium]|nr:PDZ domain-containing protein [Candidatus Cloacimonadales bacterium]